MYALVGWQHRTSEAVLSSADIGDLKGMQLALLRLQHVPFTRQGNWPGLCVHSPYAQRVLRLRVA